MGIKTVYIFFISIFLTSCSLNYHRPAVTNDLDDKYPQFRCVPLDSDDISVYVTVKLSMLELTVSRNGIQMGVESPTLGFLEFGFQDDFPFDKTSSDFLYLVVENKNWGVGKERRTYCLYPGDQKLEVIPNASTNSSLRFFIDRNNFVVGLDSQELIQYQTSGERHRLIIDMTSGEIADFEIKPVTQYPKRAMKPEEGMEHCTAMRREKSRKPFVNVAVVCASDAVEDAIGWIPSVLSHIHPSFGGISLFAVYLFLFGLLITMIKKQPDNWKGIVFTLLFVSFVCWLLLLLFNILPYSLM
jgi:hypothetical protein